MLSRKKTEKNKKTRQTLGCRTSNKDRGIVLLITDRVPQKEAGCRELVLDMPGTDR